MSDFESNKHLYKHIPTQFQPEFVSLHNQNAALLEKVNSLNRELYGSSAERHIVPPFINPAEPLFNEAEIIVDKDSQNQEPEGDNTPNPKPKKRTRSADSGGRNPLPENLRRVEIICDIPEENKICPVDGAKLVVIGEVIVEKLELIPAEVFVNRYVYLKYACPECDNTIEKASAVPAVLGTSTCDVGLLTFILMQKYLNAMPLYRLEQHFAQCDVEISRTSMARWVVLAADFIGDLAYEIKNYILKQKALHADETTVQVLKEPGKKAESKSYMWLLCAAESSHPAVWFQYETNRSGQCAKALLQSYSGLVHIDGYDGYNAALVENKATRIGCWAHVRRKFDVAKKDGAADGKSLASEMLTLIQNLFLIERQCQNHSPLEILLLRQEKSQPLVDEIKAKLDERLPKIPPKSKLGIALKYLKNEWPHLTMFLKYGEASLSNNRIENHVRPFAIGRKNWMFSDTQKGATSSALLYSIIVTAKANNLSVEKYLRKLFTELPKIYAQKQGRVNLEPFLPWNCLDCSTTAK